MLTSRIPYYVGPLDSSAAPLDAHGKARFAWSRRLPGHERAFVTPWNYEEHIDTDAAAEAFIRRMTGKCTYLVEEDVLPANSLIYERFRFLNELAGIRYTEDGGAAPYDYTAADNALDDLPGAPENYELMDMDDFLPEEPAEIRPSIQRIRRSI